MIARISLAALGVALLSTTCAVPARAERLIASVSNHRVTVTPAEVARWSRGSSGSDVEDLVRRSFEFLLEREPASSILREFDLAVIQRYFPEYDRLFRR